MVIIDKYTKYCHLIPLQHPFRAAQIAQSLLDNVFKLYGPPKSIITDRDKIFTSGFWSELFKRLGTSSHLTTAYHPQSDGQSERLNQSIEMYLRCLSNQRPHQWSRWLPMAEWWYNTSHHSAINMSPYQALYEKLPLSLNYHQVGRSTNVCVDEFLKQRIELNCLLKDNLKKAQERMKFYADKRRTEREFQEGDLVFLKLQAFKQNSLKSFKDTKFSPRYFGPYKILKRIGKVAYHLQLQDTAKIHNTFHVSLLKKKIGHNDFAQIDPPDTTNTAPPRYPARILDRKTVKRNNVAAVMVLVQWVGMLPEDASWVDYNYLRQHFPVFVGRGRLVYKRGPLLEWEHII